MCDRKTDGRTDTFIELLGHNQKFKLVDKKVLLQDSHGNMDMVIVLIEHF